MKFLLSEGTKFINARVFCQDPIEQFFGKQRGRGGGSTNPNVKKFFENTRTIHLKGNLGLRKYRGNAQEVIDEEEGISYEPLPKRRRERKSCK